MTIITEKQAKADLLAHMRHYAAEFNRACAKLSKQWQQV